MYVALRERNGNAFSIKALFDRFVERPQCFPKLPGFRIGPHQKIYRGIAELFDPHDGRRFGQEAFICGNEFLQHALNMIKIFAVAHAINDVGAPQVNYRESISKPASIKYTHKKQSGGSGQYADVQIKFEPLEPGSGFEFATDLKGGSVPKEYIPGVEKGLKDSMMTGVIAGFPVVDVRATLFDGGFHDVDSSVMAFEIAAKAAFKEGIPKCAPKLLEPMMQVDVICPEESMGDVIGDLNSRRGQIGELGDKPGGLKTVMCFVPLAEMFNYVSKLRGMTKGRANYSMKLARYEPVPMNIQQELQKAKAEKSAA